MASILPSAPVPTSSKPKVAPSSLLRNRKAVQPRPKKSKLTNDESAHSTTTSQKDKISISTKSPSKIASTVNKSSQRSVKKRKVAGVAIGLTRQQQLEQEQQQQLTGENEPESANEGVSSPNTPAIVTATPATKVNDPVIPEAQPGELRLSAFCTKYRSKDDPTQPATQQPPKAPNTLTHNNNNNNNNIDNNTNGVFPEGDHHETNAAASAGPVVQIINGEIVLQESSLYVPTARRSVEEVEEEFQHVIEEEAPLAAIGASYNSFVVNSSNSSTTGGTRGPQHWNVDDTKLFYEALRQVGTDFCTMASYFPNRNRKQLKRKYQIESSKYPHLIELALSPKVQKGIDLSVFQVDPASIVVPPPAPAVTKEEQTLTANTSPSKGTAEGNDPDVIVEDFASNVTPFGAGLETTSAPKKPSWMDETEDDPMLFPVEMDVEEEFREETADVAAFVDELDDSNFQHGNTNNNNKTVAPKAATLLGTAAVSKINKAKKPKFKAVRSRPRPK